MPKNKAAIIQHSAMGVSWDVHVYETLSSIEEQDLKKRIALLLDIFDATYSRFKKSSYVSRISTSPGTYMLPNELKEMLDLYNKLYVATDQKMNPLVGHQLEDAGYDAEYSLKPKDMIRKIVPLDEGIVTSGDTFQTKQKILIDIGALGKGYAIEMIANLLKFHNISKYLINGSGDIKVQLTDPARVGLENPFNIEQVIGVAAINNMSIASSSILRRAWRDKHHIIDPVEQEFNQKIVATWVVAERADLADALATSLFLTTPEKLLKHFTFEYALLTKDKHMHISRNFPATLF